ncbi:MAG TPA: tetratricopeptide repeat protein [Gemmatimonadales bacterium]|jgi:TolA-binding protein|nr:tetratricopeptide repeat protein [Gemmatimonadales bacterium]
MRSRVLVLASVALLGACALRSDVRNVEDQITQLKDVQDRRDQERSRQLAEVLRLQQAMMDSLSATRAAVSQLRGDFANDLYEVQRQLVQLQELTGQSQQRLSELRTQLERRAEELQQPESVPAPGTPDTSRTMVSPSQAQPSADQMYQTSLGQLRLGSASTARLGFRELLKTYPTSDKAPDALYYIGQSFETENADSALYYYQQVTRDYAQSPRAGSSYYHIGLIKERANDRAAARDAYQKVVQSFPNSDEAALARDRLKALGS